MLNMLFTFPSTLIGQYVLQQSLIEQCIDEITTGILFMGFNLLLISDFFWKIKYY